MMFGGARNLEAEYAKVFDDALETLRWVRLHYHEPRASETLRELEAKLGYLAQAMAWRLDGDEVQADQALGLARGQSIREQDAIRQMWEEMWWSH
ncbi:MAG TPA: hypothetical protein VNN21_04030 [Dehalococcoidia bacterium]|nr:hypothetical protein [Dehalococcoidia bacterium]